MARPSEHMVRAMSGNQETDSTGVSRGLDKPSMARSQSAWAVDLTAVPS